MRLRIQQKNLLISLSLPQNQTTLLDSDGVKEFANRIFTDFLSQKKEN